MWLRCAECDKKVFPEGHSLWDSWRCLAFYFQIQFTEGEITEQTYSLLLEHLLFFKRFALEDAEKRSASSED